MLNNRVSELYPVIKLKVKELAFCPGEFCMNYGGDHKDLKKSINNTGLINKPYVFKNSKGVIDLVTGFRRISALDELDIMEVSCFDLTDSGMAPFDMLKLAIHENIFTRSFNPVEKSMILNNLERFISKNEIKKEFISLLNINLKEYNLILKIEKLDDPVKQSLSGGELNLKALSQLMQLEKDDFLECHRLISELNLSYNQQVQLIDYARDISRANKITVKNLLNLNKYMTLVNDEKKNIPQKAKELMDTLRQDRNPYYYKYEKKFEGQVNKLQLPGNTKISHPRYFESEGYQLNINFKDGKDLKKTIEILSDKVELEDLKDPWLE